MLVVENTPTFFFYFFLLTTITINTCYRSSRCLTPKYLVFSFFILFFIFILIKSVGFGRSSNDVIYGQQENTAKSKVVQFIGAIQTLLRIPLIGINIVVIIYELVLG